MDGLFLDPSFGRSATRLGWTAAFAALVVLVGCATSPSGVRPGAGDGSGAETMPDFQRTPDAIPLLEPIRAGGPNKPYEVEGRSYVPFVTDTALLETGLASWYGPKFHGRGTATGETFDMYAMTAAHRTMPLPSYARVRNPANGREVIVRVNDRGPFVSDRVIDLSYAAAGKLGLLRGVAPVEVQRITYASIRSGTWRGPTADRSESARTAESDPLGDLLRRLERRSAVTERAEADRVGRMLEGTDAGADPR